MLFRGMMGIYCIYHLIACLLSFHQPFHIPDRSAQALFKRLFSSASRGFPSISPLSYPCYMCPVPGYRQALTEHPIQSRHTRHHIVLQICLFRFLKYFQKLIRLFRILIWAICNGICGRALCQRNLCLPQILTAFFSFPIFLIFLSAISFSATCSFSFSSFSLLTAQRHSPPPVARCNPPNRAYRHPPAK